MNVDQDGGVSRIAAAIAEPARTRMLYCLTDGRGRTSTELAMLAGVTPSTASIHLKRLKAQRLVKVFAQGKHRYYSLQGKEVAVALEALAVLAGSSGRLITSTPTHLRAARTCYDHVAGTLGVLLHDRFHSLGWLTTALQQDKPDRQSFDVTPKGAAAFQGIGVDVERCRSLRRRLAYPCLDWSERRPHLAGALGAAVLEAVLRRKWLVQDVDSRSLEITRAGRRELQSRFQISELV
jgi:DNA-binding transcriptional ArsR family regulator